MAKKKSVKTNDSSDSRGVASEIVPAYSQQPRVLACLILIAGAFSAWYWYRPLPPEIHEASHSGLSGVWPQSHAVPKSIWNGAGLVVPSLEIPIEVSDADSQPVTGGELVGSSDVTLVPLRERRENLSELLKTEKLPMVTIDHSLPSTLAPVKPPEPWTNEASERLSSPSLITSQKQSTPHQGTVPASPFSTPSIDARRQRVFGEAGTQWPDSDYSTGTTIERHKAARPAEVASTPPLLETGMRSIRLQDGELDTSRSKPAIVSGPPLASDTRQPQFIKQPRTKRP